MQAGSYSQGPATYSRSASCRMVNTEYHNHKRQSLGCKCHVDMSNCLDSRNVDSNRQCSHLYTCIWIVETQQNNTRWSCNYVCNRVWNSPRQCTEGHTDMYQNHHKCPQILLWNASTRHRRAYMVLFFHLYYHNSNVYNVDCDHHRIHKLFLGR